MFWFLSTCLNSMVVSKLLLKKIYEKPSKNFFHADCMVGSRDVDDCHTVL